MAAGSEYTLANRYPIHRACRDGDTNALDGLLQCIDEPDTGKTNSNAFACEDSFYGWMPIHWAAYHGQLACIRKLLSFATPEASSLNQLPQFGAVETQLTETWNSLIDARASNFRQTPVHLAAYGNHVECLKWLLDAGASPHITDSLGETSAHKAARGGGMECLSLLLAHGVNLSVVNNAGQTAADLAAVCGHTRCSAYVRSSQLLQTGGTTSFGSMGEETSDMDIDQNAPEAVFVNGTYGYQPHYAVKPSISVRKRATQEAEPVLGLMNDDKRCKKSWRKDDIDAVQQERSQYMCATKTDKSWMSGHCLM